MRGAGNEEMFHFFVTPQVMADLKLDSDFLSNVRSAGIRGPNNELFAGSSSLMVDGVMVHEFRHVPNTSGATSGSSSNAGSAGYKGGAVLMLIMHHVYSAVLNHLQWLILVFQK